MLSSPAAIAQDDADPFKFLKPWIEERLFGQKPAAESPAPPSPESPPAPEAAAPPSPASEGPPAATPPAGTPPAGESTTAETPKGPAEEASDMMLRGATEDDAAALSTMAAEAKPEPLRFALLAGRSTAGTMAAVGPVADALTTLIGRPVEFLPLQSYDAMIDAQNERRIDGGFFSAAAFALADARCTCIEPLVAPRASDGTLAYHAVIAVRADSGIAKLADLAGKTVAVGREDSIGARRAQLAGLLVEGVDPATAFGTVLEVESPETAVRMVLAGSADAAFAWSSLAGDVGSGYSRGTFAELVAAGGIDMRRIAILWRSAAIGHAPFAVTRTLAEADKDRMRAYLVGLVTSNPAAYDTLNPFYGGGYAEAEVKNYSALETLMTQNLDAVHLPLAPAQTGTTSAAEAGATGGVESSPAGAETAPAP